MSDRIDEKAICPYYLGVTRSSKLIGVHCENIEKNLGFRVDHFIRLQSYRDLKDFTEIFCCDQWKQCPYAKVLMNIWT